MRAADDAELNKVLQKEEEYFCNSRWIAFHSTNSSLISLPFTVLGPLSHTVNGINTDRK
jgi:hypothetical protein